MKTVLDREDLIFSPPEPGCVFCIAGLPGSGSRIYDRSPYGKQGTVTGAGWARLPGGFWGLSSDGVDDSISVSDWDNGLLGSDYTVEQWVKSDNLLVKGYAIGLIGLTCLYSRALSAFEIQRHLERERSLFGVW